MSYELPILSVTQLTKLNYTLLTIENTPIFDSSVGQIECVDYLEVGLKNHWTFSRFITFEKVLEIQVDLEYLIKLQAEMEYYLK